MWRVDGAGVTIRCVNEWIRPYHDPVRVVTGGLAMFGSAFFAFTAVMMVAQWRETTVIEAVVLVGFAAVWLTFLWRLHRTALLVGFRGARVRWLLRTRTIPWHQIREFRTRKERSITRLFIALIDGTMVRTPVQRLRGRLFGSVLSDGGTWLLPEPYDQTLSYLQTRLSDARSREVAG